MTSDAVALVIGASQEEFERVRGYLSEWQCVSGPLNDEQTAVSSMPATVKLIFVYAREDQRKTLAICGQLRATPGMSAVPILLAVGRYDLPQGQAVERLGNATYIIGPIAEKELRDGVANLLEDS